MVALALVAGGFLILVNHQSIAKRFNKNRYNAPKTIENRGLPRRLRIPSIGVDSKIVQVGLTDTGAMATPTNSTDVGWFEVGPYPGQVGNAVIAGHLDSPDGRWGVFKRLNELKQGDRLYIDDGDRTYVFVVRESDVYEAGYAEGIFGQSEVAHLNLVTCDGIWLDGVKSYSKRIVVFADMDK